MFEDDEYRKRRYKKAKEILEKMTLKELQWTLGRYCGRGNAILSDKKFGIIMPQELVEQFIQDKSFEEIVLEVDSTKAE